MSPRTGQALARLAEALAGEHAAIYAYGLIGARLDAVLQVQARQADAAHRNRRDALLVELASAGATPPGPAAQYALPFPVEDVASAVRLAILVEERTATLWRYALPATVAGDRRFALDALTDAALRAARWRRASGTIPGTVALPGA